MLIVSDKPKSTFNVRSGKPARESEVSIPDVGTSDGAPLRAMSPETVSWVGDKQLESQLLVLNRQGIVFIRRSLRR